MNTGTNLLLLGILLAAAVNGAAQPILTCQPSNQTAIAGSTVAFTVCATGTEPLSYQWRSHANQTTFTNIPFGTEATLVLTNAQPITRRFAVVVTDAGGLSATSSPPVTLTVMVPPSITTQPLSQNAVSGERVTFSVAVEGTAPLAYQWRLNGQPILGAIRSNLVFNSIQFSNAGAYAVVITNFIGLITSQVANLTVVPSTSFTRVSDGPVVTDPSGGTGCVWADFNNDGLADLIVIDAGGKRNFLYHNSGGGAFSNVTVGPFLIPAAGSSPQTASWGDYDNDGYLDLFLSYNDHNVLYRNNHDGAFTEIRNVLMVTETPQNGDHFRTICWVDYDNDGFLDMFLTGSAHNLLYHNSGNSNRWLEVKCVGTASNRSAIGAKIRVQATIAGKQVWQLREMKSGGGWVLATPLVAHFGLGDATNVETLRIEWPSGTIQELHNVMPGQILTITEPPRLTASKADGQPLIALKGGRGFEYGIEASTDLSIWSPIGSVVITNRSGTATIADLDGVGTKQKFYRAVFR